MAAPQENIADSGQGLGVIRLVAKNEVILFSRLIELFLPRKHSGETHTRIVVEGMAGQYVTEEGNGVVPPPLPREQLGRGRADFVIVRPYRQVLPIGGDGLLILLLFLQGLRSFQHMARRRLLGFCRDRRNGRTEPDDGEQSSQEEAHNGSVPTTPHDEIVHP